MTASRAPQRHPEDTDHDILLDAEDDRWEWRRRIRANPRHHRIYRAFVGAVGVTLLLLAGATGWLPGPGGIPLALVGLAVLASEFEFAQRVLDWAKRLAHTFTSWTARQPVWIRVGGAVLTAAGVLGGMWLTLRVFGLPGWAPGQVIAVLGSVPGLG